jgi:hypothetical protein
MKKLLFLLFLLTAALSVAQQPQSHTAPLFAVNAKYTNGVAPGYAPTKGTGLTLNLGSGTTDCLGTLIEYAGGTLTMTDNTTNYVYLDPSSSCAPTSSTSIFTSAHVWIAKVTTSGGAITAIDDVRTSFLAPGTGSSGIASITFSSPLSGGTITTSGTVGCATCAIGPGSSTANHLAKFSGTDGLTLADGGAIPATYTLPTQYTKLRCETGLGDGLNAMPAGTYLQSFCYNDSGVTWTITGIKCYTDGGTPTLQVDDNSGNHETSDGGHNYFTCTSSFAAGTQNGTQWTTGIPNGGWLAFTFVAGGTAKQTTWVVSLSQ